MYWRMKEFAKTAWLSLMGNYSFWNTNNTLKYIFALPHTLLKYWFMLRVLLMTNRKISWTWQKQIIFWIHFASISFLMHFWKMQTFEVLHMPLGSIYHVLYILNSSFDRIIKYYKSWTKESYKIVFVLINVSTIYWNVF